MSDELLPDLLAAVEQQMVSPQTKYVAKTFERLVKARAGGNGGEAPDCAVPGRGNGCGIAAKAGFDEKAYRAALDALPMDTEEDTEDEAD